MFEKYTFVDTSDQIVWQQSKESSPKIIKKCHLSVWKLFLKALNYVVIDYSLHSPKLNIFEAS